MLPKISQYPETGKHLLRYCGDTLEIRMRCDRKVTGSAYLSTNIGNAVLRRSEIIAEAEQNLLSAGQDSLSPNLKTYSEACSGYCSLWNKGF